jgi:N-acylneuraminate cytidylyltransferase/CMP-N,N'-diacetyllegionaminic acid synthase
MLRICTILARGGSKGVPGKNLRPLAGKPLIAHSIEQARAARLFDAIAVSSDSAEILKVAEDYGAGFAVRRPDAMATDTAAKLPAVQHCVTDVERKTGKTFDLVVDLDPTSPLRAPEDIAGAVRLMEERRVSSVITGAVARKSPYFNLVERGANGFVRLCKKSPTTVNRRQDGPACFDMNAAVYVWPRDVLMADARVFYDDTLLYEMPPERSHDIDSSLDFAFVEFVMQLRSAA